MSQPMFLWDTNVLTHHVNGDATLRAHLQRTPWTQIALPSVVVAEVLRGRAEFALKAEAAQLPLAHQLLRDTQKLLDTFHVVEFDDACVPVLQRLQARHRAHKRHADLMIAAIALAGNHIIVTRNQRHFADLLPAQHVANWVDDLPR